MYDYSGNLNFFWITTVLFILFIYCKPSFPELEKLLKPDLETVQVEDINDTQEQENIKSVKEIDEKGQEE